MRKAVSISGLVLLSLCLVPLLFMGPFLLGTLAGRAENARIRQEVFTYVLEHEPNLPRESRQDVPYTTTGFSDAGVEYGFFYHPGYQTSGSPYRSGHLLYGRPNTGQDWRYEEPICEGWYYYEEHFG